MFSISSGLGRLFNRNRVESPVAESANNRQKTNTSQAEMHPVDSHYATDSEVSGKSQPSIRQMSAKQRRAMLSKINTSGIQTPRSAASTPVINSAMSPGLDDAEWLTRPIRPSFSRHHSESNQSVASEPVVDNRSTLSPKLKLNFEGRESYFGAKFRDSLLFKEPGTKENPAPTPDSALRSSFTSERSWVTAPNGLTTRNASVASLDALSGLKALTPLDKIPLPELGKFFFEEGRTGDEPAGVLSTPVEDRANPLHERNESTSSSTLNGNEHDAQPAVNQHTTSMINRRRGTYFESQSETAQIARSLPSTPVIEQSNSVEVPRMTRAIINNGLKSAQGLRTMEKATREQLFDMLAKNDAQGLTDWTKENNNVLANFISSLSTGQQILRFDATGSQLPKDLQSSLEQLRTFTQNNQDLISLGDKSATGLLKSRTSEEVGKLREAYAKAEDILSAIESDLKA